VVAFIEQVPNIEKSKASVVEVISCFATVKARIQERQSDEGYISSQACFVISFLTSISMYAV